MTARDPELSRRLALATETLDGVRPGADEGTLDLLRASGLLESSLEVAGLRCALGTRAQDVTTELELAARAAAAIFGPSAGDAGVQPDGVEPDTSPRNPWTLVRGLYAGVVAAAAAPTDALAQHARAPALTDLVTAGAELRACALSLAALLRGDVVPPPDDQPGDPEPDPMVARLWSAQREGIAALAAEDHGQYEQACRLTAEAFDALYADAPPSDPERALRLPVLGMERLAGFVAARGSGR